MYGKDWTMIQRHVGTRKITNVRAHAQKFLMKLLKTVDNQDSLPNEEVMEAKYFYEILNNKMHKTFSKQLK